MRKRRANGDGCIVVRGSSYYLRAKDLVTGKYNAHVLYLDGKKCTTLDQAKEAAMREAKERRRLEMLETKEEMLLKIAQNKQLIVSIKYSIDDLWDRFTASPTRPQTISEDNLNYYRMHVSRFVEWCRGKGVSSMYDVTRDLVINYLNVQEVEQSPGISNRAKACLFYVFKHTWREFGMPGNPVSDIQNKKTVSQRRMDFTKQQVDAIFEGFEKGFWYEKETHDGVTQAIEFRPDHFDEYRIVMLIAAYTGARMKDACLFRWDQVDFEKNTLSFVPYKTRKSSGKDVVIPIHSRLRAAFVEAQRWRINDYVCPDLANEYARCRLKITRTVQTLIHCATGLKLTSDKKEGRKRRANVYGMHSFRHTFMSFCANAGIPIPVLESIIGVTSKEMAEHYYHASMEAKEKAVEAIKIGALPPSMSPMEKLAEWAKTATSGQLEKVLEFAQSLTSSSETP